jgi:hypothetical protein
MKSWKKWSLKVDAEQTCQGEPLPNPWLKPKYLYIAAFHSTLVSYKPRWHRENPERYFPKSPWCEDPCLSRFTAGLRVALPWVSVYLRCK